MQPQNVMIKRWIWCSSTIFFANANILVSASEWSVIQYSHSIESLYGAIIFVTQMIWLSHKDCWNWMTQVLKMNSVRFDLLLGYEDMMKHSLAYSDL